MQRINASWRKQADFPELFLDELLETVELIETTGVLGRPYKVKTKHRVTRLHGDCMLSDECAPNLICSPSAGPKYGLGVNRACAPAHCDNNIFEPALGETSRDCGNECGCSGVCAGQPCP
jgi:hypothetical protein